MATTDWEHAKLDGMDYDTMTAPERRQYAHDQAIDYLEHCWDDIGYALGYIQGRLSYLEMDLTNAHRPQGCCRQLTCIPFTDYYCNSGVAVLRVLGLRAGEEPLVQQIFENLPG
jgi:hypothetical protein